MADTNYEVLGGHLEQWVNNAPELSDDPVLRDAQDALIQAGMVKFNPDGWDFTLHQDHPDAPRAQFKLMIREADGVDTNPAFYDRFVLPSVYLAEGELKSASSPDYIVGYPNAGTPIAAAFARLTKRTFNITIEQLIQEKITHEDGTRELGDITSSFEPGKIIRAIDDTATGGATKIQGWEAINRHGLQYAGLSLIVERDPLGTALVRQRTGADVTPSMHWLSLVKRAVDTQGLPADALQREMDYSMRLFEWNVANDITKNLPDPSLQL